MCCPSSAHTLHLYTVNINHQDGTDFRDTECPDYAAEGRVPRDLRNMRHWSEWGEIGPGNHCHYARKDSGWEIISVLYSHEKKLEWWRVKESFSKRITLQKSHKVAIGLEVAEAKSWQFHHGNCLGNDQGNTFHCSNVKLLVSGEECEFISWSNIHSTKEKSKETENFIIDLLWLRHPWCSSRRNYTGEEDSYYIS